MSKYRCENVSEENLTDPILAAVIVVTVVIILLILNIHYARELGVFKWLKVRRKKIAIMLSWSLGVALITIKSYWLVYINNWLYIGPNSYRSGIVWVDIFSTWAPALSTLDLALMLIISLIAGAILLDIEAVLYSFVAQSFLSFMFAVIWASFFIWYVLQFGQGQGAVDFWTAIQVMLYYAIKNVFRMAFPLTFLLCFLGAFLGAFARALFRPEA